MQTRTFLTSHPSSPAINPIISLFQSVKNEIASEKHQLAALEVLQLLQPELTRLGFTTAVRPGVKSKKSVELRADDPDESLMCRFDAVNKGASTSLVVHAGRGVTNNDYLKSLIHASLAAEIRHHVFAVRNTYKSSSDYNSALKTLAPLWSSRNTKLDLDSLTIIGY